MLYRNRLHKFYLQAFFLLVISCRQMAGTPQPSLKKKILNSLRRWGRGSVFSNQDFFAFGSDTAVASCLHLLKKEGVIRMLLRGLYEYPRFNHFLNENIAPDLHRVAEALARKYRWHIQPSGNSALQYWGLSTQIPLRLLYFSDGPNRHYTIEGRSLDFKHISRMEADFPHRDCEMFVQAIKELGEHSLVEPYHGKLQALLTPKLRQQLTSISPWLTERDRTILRKIIAPHE